MITTSSPIAAHHAARSVVRVCLLLLRQWTDQTLGLGGPHANHADHATLWCRAVRAILWHKHRAALWHRAGRRDNHRIIYVQEPREGSTGVLQEVRPASVHKSTVSIQQDLGVEG